MKYTFGKSVDDTKPCSTADSLEGRDAIQNNFDRLEECIHVNAMKGQKNNQRAETPLPWRQAKRAGFFQTGEEQVRWDSTVAFQYRKTFQKGV